MMKFDPSLVAATMRGYDRNNLFGFISTVIRKDESLRLMEMYKVKTHRLRGRDKAKQEVYLAVRDALKVAKDWTTFQRELAKSGVSMRKKYRRGTTIVEGLSFVNGKYKFKASEVAKKRKFSFANIDRILNENKNGRPQSPPARPVASPRVVTTAPKHEPCVVEKVIDTGLEIGESLSGAVGNLFHVGPGYNADEEAFAREMERRRKKAKKKGRSI